MFEHRRVPFCDLELVSSHFPCAAEEWFLAVHINCFPSSFHIHDQWSFGSCSIQVLLLWSDRAQDKEWLDLLWEVGRSVTIQVRLCPSETDWALARNHASECLKSIKDAALSATFIDFARIVRQLNIQQVSDGTHHKLRFNNAPYNASMHRAAMGILSLINDGPEFEASMSKLELAYGRDLLSNAYSKLNRLQQISKGVATAAQATPNGSAQNLVKLQVGWWEWFTLLCVWAWPIQARQQKFGFWATGSMGPTGIGRHASLLWRWGGQNM